MYSNISYAGEKNTGTVSILVHTLVTGCYCVLLYVGVFAYVVVVGVAGFLMCVRSFSSERGQKSNVSLSHIWLSVSLSFPTVQS